MLSGKRCGRYDKRYLDGELCVAMNEMIDSTSDLKGSCLNLMTVNSECNVRSVALQGIPLSHKTTRQSQPNDITI